MDLQAYLTRIGFSGPARPDLETLRGLVAAHVEAVPFENLDVQLRRRVDLTVAAAYAKVVDRRRGGWCYELNGLFGWALGEIGFDVRRLSAAVLRDRLGDSQRDTHLCLLVTVDGDSYLVDVGFGSSLLAPLPLREIERHDPPFTVSLACIDDGWRFSEQLRDGDPFTFDFDTAVADEAGFAVACDRQQTDPESPFRRRLGVQRRDGDAHVTLRGSELTRVTEDGVTSETLPDDAAVIAALRRVFEIETDALRGGAVEGHPEDDERHAADLAG